MTKHVSDNNRKDGGNASVRWAEKPLGFVVELCRCMFINKRRGAFGLLIICGMLGLCCVYGISGAADGEKSESESAQSSGGGMKTPGLTDEENQRMNKLISDFIVTTDKSELAAIQVEIDKLSELAKLRLAAASESEVEPAGPAVPESDFLVGDENEQMNSLMAAMMAAQAAGDDEQAKAVQDEIDKLMQGALSRQAAKKSEVQSEPKSRSVSKNGLLPSEEKRINTLKMQLKAAHATNDQKKVESIERQIDVLMEGAITRQRKAELGEPSGEDTEASSSSDDAEVDELMAEVEAEVEAAEESSDEAAVEPDSDPSETEEPAGAADEKKNEPVEAVEQALPKLAPPPVIPKPDPQPDDIVKLDLKDDQLDLGMLIETVGKELGFSFLYDNASEQAFKVKLRQYGDVRRGDLLPLLESVLSFSGQTLVREDPFIRVVNKVEATKKATPYMGFGLEMPDIAEGDAVVTQIVPLQYTQTNTAKAFLTNFTPDASGIIDVPGSNQLIITEYAQRLERLLQLIELIDQPGPERALEVMDLEFVKADDVKGQIEELLAALAEQGVLETGGEGAPAPVRIDPRTKRPIRNPASPSTGGSSGKDGPTILVDERTNRLLVVATEDEMDMIQELLDILDIDRPDLEISLEVFTIEYVEAAEIVDQLDSLLEALSDEKASTATTGESGTAAAAPAAVKAPQPVRSRTSRTRDSGDKRTGPFLLADERTNRVLMVGTDEQVDQIEDLLFVLDVPPVEYGQQELFIHQPQYVEAEEVRRILDDLEITRSTRQSARDRARTFERGRTPDMRARTTGDENNNDGGFFGAEEPDVRIAIQESTNRIFIMATAKQLKDIREIMEYIDIEPEDRLGAIKIYKLENRDPESVQEMLTELMESKQEVMQGEQNVNVPGREGAPIIVALKDIHAVAVRGTKTQHEEIAAIIEQLDERLPQVLIEAILVQINADDILKVGISLKDKWELGGSRMISGISPFPLGELTQSDNNIVSGTGGTLAFFDDSSVYATLEALQEAGNAKIVSRPRILVSDNFGDDENTATITSTRSEPTTKTTIQAGSDTPIIEFNEYQEAGTTLEIVPHISEGNFLQLDITLTVDSFDGQSSGNIPPPKSNNELTTMVTVPDGKTIILGGLTTQTNSIDVKKVPVLGDLPLVGALFRNTARSNINSVLYVFVRAHIVRSQGENSEFQDLERLSQPEIDKVKKGEDAYYQTPLIPGLPAEKRPLGVGVFE